ncbi:MAG: recombinase family protein [Sulfolobales archaeon]
MNQAIAYIRISREDENPDNQWFVIKDYCDKRGYMCIRLDEIGVSRVEDPFQRMIFQTALRIMEVNRISVLIAESIDRVCADPEHYERLIKYFAERGWRLELVRDTDISEAFNRVIEIFEKLKNSADSAVMSVVLDSQIKSLKDMMQLYHKLKVAVAREYVEDVRRKVRRALERLKSEGKIYTKPTMIHWIALYRSGKKRFTELSKGDLEDAERYFIERYVKPYREGVPIRRLWSRFLEAERPIIDMIRRHRINSVELKKSLGKPEPKKYEVYTSYLSFYRLVKKLAGGENKESKSGASSHKT